MTRAVFIASSHTTYRDMAGETYHFPAMYLSRVAQVVGDWAIFFEGRRGGSRGYYAAQRVEKILPDTSDPTHYYAILDRGSALQFENNVARLRHDETPWETGLPLVRGSNTASVRLISDTDFTAIVSAGMAEVEDEDTLPRTGPLLGFAEEHVGFLPPLTDRTMVLTSRALRDRAFARQVKRAYAGRCAMSGLALRNGGGRPEVEAAHILPVEERGPDMVCNGLALSGTVHWMFDRGLVSVDDDGAILVARGSIADEVADRLLAPDRRLIPPAVAANHPHPAYLEWHRRARFKG